MKPDRVYRPVEPSDLPKIQAGTLKAFQKMGPHDYYPATLITARLAPSYAGSNQTEGWLVKGINHDYLEWTNNYIFVDVTPEKRYAIWNHKMQRFAFPLVHEMGFNSRQEAEMYMAEEDLNPKAFYIVEWEIKKDE